jgi:hypothetical protein
LVSFLPQSSLLGLSCEEEATSSSVEDHQGPELLLLVLLLAAASVGDRLRLLLLPEGGLLAEEGRGERLLAW